MMIPLSVEKLLALRVRVRVRPNPNPLCVEKLLALGLKVSRHFVVKVAGYPFRKFLGGDPCRYTACSRSSQAMVLEGGGEGSDPKMGNLSPSTGEVSQLCPPGASLPTLRRGEAPLMSRVYSPPLLMMLLAVLVVVLLPHLRDPPSRLITQRTWPMRGYDCWLNLPCSSSGSRNFPPRIYRIFPLSLYPRETT